jgi:hypothetical protein
LFIFLGAQEGFAVCLDTKVTKKSSRQGGFFAARARPLAFPWPSPCKAGRTTGCNYFALLRPLMAFASAKTCYALSCAQDLHCSTRFRPKLTCRREGEKKQDGKSKETRQKKELNKGKIIIISKTKARRPDKKAGLGVWPAGGSIFLS